MNTSSNGALDPRRWQPRTALRDDLDVAPSLFDVNDAQREAERELLVLLDGDDAPRSTSKGE